jgi:hypothetical protein
MLSCGNIDRISEKDHFIGLFIVDVSSSSISIRAPDPDFILVFFRVVDFFTDSALGQSPLVLNVH